jgi:hypothetical protein
VSSWVINGVVRSQHHVADLPEIAALPKRGPFVRIHIAIDGLNDDGTKRVDRVNFDVPPTDAIEWPAGLPVHITIAERPEVPF